MSDKSRNGGSRPLNPVALNDLILRSIVDHAIVAMDADGIITRWNEGAERILGWSAEEAVGQHGSLFFTPADVERSRPETEMQRALQEGRAEDERWHMRRDGRRFWGSGLMMPLLAATDEDGDAVQCEAAVEGFVKVFRDATHEEKDPGALNRMESSAALAMRESRTVGVYDFDLLEDIVSADPVNAAFHSVSKAAAAEGTPSKEFFDGVYPEDEPEVRAAVDRSIADGSDLDVTYRVALPGSRPRWVHSQGSIQRDGEGRVARLSGIVTEVTDEVERTRMQAARLRFADAVREMDDPIAIAAFACRVIGETLYASRVADAALAEGGLTIRAD